MKKRIYLLIVSIMLIFFFSLDIEAQVNYDCNLNVTLLNQDPYPAIPGDYVKLVFQIDGAGNPKCEDIFFELSDDFPLVFSKGEKRKFEFKSGGYQRNFGSFVLATYKVLINDAAAEGDHSIKTLYGYGKELQFIKDFNINVDDVKTDFEVYIKDYDFNTDIITFGILNIGDNDVEALTIEIDKQPNINIKGSNRNIVGGLDSTEDTTFTFEAIPKEGEIKLKIFYNDEINVRRTLEKTVVFDKTYFIDRKKDEKKTPVITYSLLIIFSILILWFITNKMKKRKK